MKNKKLLLIGACLWAPLSYANPLSILSPQASGNVDSYFPLERAFDAPPQWVDSMPQSTTSAADAPAYANRLGYIDFGPDFHHYRIVQTWTQYRSWSGGDHYGYSEMWWDNDRASYNDGIAETRLAFNSAKAMPHQGAELWQADMVLDNEQAITPPARYLMIRAASNITSRAKEYALVGWMDNSSTPPPDIGAKTPLLTLPHKNAFDHSQLTLVDEIDFSKPVTHEFKESAPNVSKLETLLGKQCRSMDNSGNDGKYFAYKLAAGNKLQAGKGYVLVVDYPEDKARSIIVSNHGAEMNRGFHTGNTTGDALNAPYERPTAESIHYGLSQQTRSFEQLFHLHDRTPELGSKPKTSGVRTLLPKDGFWLAIGQFSEPNAPQSAGAAVCRIALYEAPNLSQYTQPLTLPPEGLPQRQLFFREEMADGVISAQDSSLRGVDDAVDWYEYRAKLMKFLGLNTYSQDLLEFGHNQGWDSGPYTDKDESWFVLSQYPHRWENLLARLMTKNYGFNLLPYYEYAGSDGNNGLGKQKVSEPLGCDDCNYTKAGWSEQNNIDVSDPRAIEDAKRLIDATLIDQYRGMRPIPKDVGSSRGLDNGWQLGWGYIDFGEQWQNITIRQGWTRSRLWHGGASSPYLNVHWYNGDLAKFNPAQIDNATIEPTINFITQRQSNTSYAWSQDFAVDENHAITPKGRYLMLEADPNFVDIYELLLLGSAQADPQSLDVLTVTGGAVSATGSKHDMALAFDNQPEFNDSPGLNASGIWLRPRLSAMPFGFGDPTRTRFAQENSLSEVPTKAQLQANSQLLAQYYVWWQAKRKVFLNQLRDHIQTKIGPEAVVLFTADANECGAKHPSDPTRIVSDELSDWTNTSFIATPSDVALEKNLHLEAQTLPASTWGGYEYHHAIPRPDVNNYQNNQGVLMTYSFNDLFTVSKPDSLAAFNSQSGLAAIRHFCLNEDAMSASDNPHLLGYFVTDMEPAGPYITLPEARALANGDPFYFGYLSSTTFNRSFPGYVRDFNANYLALPALTSSRNDALADKDNIAIRTIETPEHGTWLAVMNIGLEEVLNTNITLPHSGTVTHAVTGQPMTLVNGKVQLTLAPGQLVSIRISGQ